MNTRPIALDIAAGVALAAADGLAALAKGSRRPRVMRAVRIAQVTRALAKPTVQLAGAAVVTYRRAWRGTTTTTR